MKLNEIFSNERVALSALFVAAATTVYFVRSKRSIHLFKGFCDSGLFLSAATGSVCVCAGTQLIEI